MRGSSLFVCQVSQSRRHASTSVRRPHMSKLPTMSSLQFHSCSLTFHHHWLRSFPAPTFVLILQNKRISTFVSPQMSFRALIQTHHMTSRKKISALTKAAKKCSCAVVIKTGPSPGVMIAEAEDKEDVEAWVQTVKVFCPSPFSPRPLGRHPRHPYIKPRIPISIFLMGYLLLSIMQSLRYKDFHLLDLEASNVLSTTERPCLPQKPGQTQEVTSMKDLITLLDERGMLAWCSRTLGGSQLFHRPLNSVPDPAEGAKPAGQP